MNRAAAGAWKSSLPWLALAVLAATVLAWRLQLSFDLSLFFPRTSGLEQQILLEQMTRGPGSRFILVGIGGADADRLAQVSEELKRTLASRPDFVQVQNGLPPDEDSEVPPVIMQHRFLLADLDFSEAALHDALQERLQDLAFGGGAELLRLIAADPYLSVLQILQRLAPVELSANPWFSVDGQAVLMAETREAATDIAAQARAVAEIRAAVAELDPEGELRLDLTGVGAFGVELQRTIRAEATWRSTMATLGLLMVLIVAYRRLREVLLAGIPLAMGLLCGLALVALVFGEIHGITLAFGFTLLGIAIDYPLHLFSHSRSEPPASAIARIWPTLRIGALSSLLAYLAVMFAGSRGLAQLGLFTAGGLVAAVATTRLWLPRLLPVQAEYKATPGGPERPGLRVWPALGALLSAAAIVWAGSSVALWEDSLSSLSPLPPERLQQDNRLRQALGSADMRYQLVMHDQDLESLLLRNERLEDELAAAADDGILGGWQSVDALLPSLATQRQRAERIPADAELDRRLAAALADLPFQEDAFRPFLAAAAEARAGQPLTPDSYRGTPFAALLDAHLFRVGGRWVSLTFLQRPDPQALASRVAAWDEAVELTDIRVSSDRLLRDFRLGAVRAVGLASLLMIGLLFLDRHRPRRVLWLALTVASTLAVTVALLVVLQGSLNVMHLVGLLLVFGLGLDYALFASREESAGERLCTRHALVACMASTVLAFGILGGSSVPLLKNLGLTVALGSATSFLLAWAGRGPMQRAPG